MLQVFIKSVFFCTGVNGTRELWLAHSHSGKVKEVINSNEILWLLKRKGRVRDTRKTRPEHT